MLKKRSSSSQDLVRSTMPFPPPDRFRPVLCLQTEYVRTSNSIREDAGLQPGPLGSGSSNPAFTMDGLADRSDTDASLTRPTFRHALLPSHLSAEGQALPSPPRCSGAFRHRSERFIGAPHNSGYYRSCFRAENIYV